MAPQNPSTPPDALGEILPFDRGTTLEHVRNLLQEHRAKINEVAGDLPRVMERVDRALPELQRQLAIAQSEACAIWVPGGDAERLERYLLPDGSVRLGRSKDSYLLPDGSTDEVVSHGFLTDPFPVTKEQDVAQRAYASLALAFMRAKRMKAGDNPWKDPLVRKSFNQFRRSMRSVPGKVGNFLRSMFSDPAVMARVVNNTSGTGGELISVPTVSQIRRPADLARRLVGLIPHMEVAAESFKQPTVSGRALAKKRGKTNNDPQRYSVATFTTSDTTLSVVDQVLNVLVDPLWAASASIILEDPMSLVYDWMMKGWADTWELAFLHGDTAGSHGDTINTWTMGGYYSAGDLGGSDSPLKWFMGFRAEAGDDAKTASAGGTWDAADHFSAIEMLGVHAGGNVVAITGLHCLYTQLLSYSGFTTVQNYGDRATLHTGEIGSIGGKPVIISEFMTNDVDSTSGFYTGSNASTSMLYVDLDAYTYYEHTPGSDDYDALYPERGAQYVGQVRRGLLAQNCVSTETPCALLYNL